jgi:hypothetical protein
MHLPPYARAALACSLLLLAAAAHAAPPDPLRLVPEQADIVLELKRPAELYQRVNDADIVTEARKLEFAKEQLDSTNVRRLDQFISYFERELKMNRVELIDALTGGGVVLAAKSGTNPAPALFVVRAKDEKALEKFVKLSLDLVEQELVRQESKQRIERGSYRDVETVQFGPDFHAARAGDALLISNKKEALHLALDLHRDGPAKSLTGSKLLADARKMLPADALATAWVNLAEAQKQQGFKDFFSLPSFFPPFTILFGGYFDLVRRSPFVAAALVPEKDGFLATVRLPRGRDGMAPGLEAHTPPADAPGSLPLLEPRGVLFSTSFYLDTGKLWDERTKLFRKEDVKNLEQFDDTTKLFLAGSQMSKLLTQAGPHHRFVVVNQPKAGYTKQPDTNLPAFAFVTRQKDAEFGKSLNAVIRGVALLGGGQFGIKLVEEKVGGHDLVGYRFPEDRKLDPDAQNLRFNVSPCFANVGDSFMICSTLELGREMVELLAKEAKSPGKPSPAAVRSRFYGDGGAEALKSLEDLLATQAFLGLALPVGDAKKEVQAVIYLVRRLGVLEAADTYEGKSFRYDFRLMLDKK